MKKLLIMLAAALLLCGCSDITVDEDGTVVVSEAKVGISFPDGWDVYTGSDIYEKAYSRTGGSYGSADEMKKSLEENGERYIVYALAPDESALALFSAQSIKDASVSLEELARSTHNTTVFDFRANDFYTESSLTAEAHGGVEGWYSVINVYEKDGEPLMLEQSEFLFECGENVYSLKTFTDSTELEQIDEIRISTK